jgi:hypothetical protein
MTLHQITSEFGYTLIKKKTKFSSYLRKMVLGAMSYMRKGFLIFEEIRKYLVKNEEADSHT